MRKEWFKNVIASGRKNIGTILNTVKRVSMGVGTALQKSNELFKVIEPYVDREDRDTYNNFKNQVQSGKDVFDKSLNVVEQGVKILTS
jgi:hypothetical protein